MTKDEALKMAIEWMDKWHDKEVIVMGLGTRWVDFSMAIQACKEALEHPAQEPQYLYVYRTGRDMHLGRAPHPAMNMYGIEILGKIKLEVDDGQ